MILNISFTGGRNGPVAPIHFLVTSCVRDILLMIWCFKHLQFNNYLDCISLFSVLQMLNIVFVFFFSECTVVLNLAFCSFLSYSLTPVCLYPHRRIVNDTYRTDLCLLYPPFMIALGNKILKILNSVVFFTCMLFYLNNINRDTELSGSFSGFSFP